MREWTGPLYEVRAHAPDMGWRMRCEVHLAVAFDGDVVVVRSQSVARDGNIVVARIDDEATVKKFREKNGKAYLEAANPKYAPIRDERMEVLGVVVEVRRQYKP